MPQIAKVAVSAANYAIDKPYDYLLPDGTDAAVGSRRARAVRAREPATEGMILSLERKTPEKALKAVREVLEPEPVCSEREIRLALGCASAISARFMTPSARSCPRASGTATASSGSSRTTRARMRISEKEKRSTRF